MGGLRSLSDAHIFSMPSWRNSSSNRSLSYAVPDVQILQGLALPIVLDNLSTHSPARSTRRLRLRDGSPRVCCAGSQFRYDPQSRQLLNIVQTAISALRSQCLISASPPVSAIAAEIAS